jgi:dolichyldiphosphatase
MVFAYSLQRRTGWIEWALDIRWARMLRMRDLVIGEDLVDAGWERWEAKRRKRQVEANGVRKKTR